MNHRMVCLVQHVSGDITLHIEQAIRYVSKTVEAVREGMSAPRRFKGIKNDIYFAASDLQCYNFHAI